MRKVLYVIISILILGLYAFGLESAQTAKGQLETIKEGIPTYWWEGGWDKLSELQTFINNNPAETALCAEAQYYIGCYYFGIGSYQSAIDAYQKVLTTYPTTRLECSKAQFEIAQIYFHRLKNAPQAITEYRKLITDYPESFLAPAAQLNLGKCYRFQEDYRTALSEYQKVLTYSGAETQQMEALLETGDMYIEEGLALNYEEAKKAKIGEALTTYKKAYITCPLENVDMMQKIVDRIYKGFKVLDMGLARANEFVKYQKYGAAGEDRIAGTIDDLKNPLEEF